MRDYRKIIRSTIWKEINLSYSKAKTDIKRVLQAYSIFIDTSLRSQKSRRLILSSQKNGYSTNLGIPGSTAVEIHKDQIPDPPKIISQSIRGVASLQKLNGSTRNFLPSQLIATALQGWNHKSQWQGTTEGENLRRVTSASSYLPTTEHWLADQHHRGWRIAEFGKSHPQPHLLTIPTSGDAPQNISLWHQGTQQTYFVWDLASQLESPSNVGRFRRLT